MDGMRFAILSEDGLFTGTREVPPPIAFTAGRQDGGRPMWAQDFHGSFTCELDNLDVIRQMVVGEIANRFDLALAGRCKRRMLPRTVREAKSRRKGNRGNPKRRKAKLYTHTVLHDVHITRVETDTLSDSVRAPETRVEFTCGPNVRMESMGALGGVPAAQRAINER